MIVRGGATRFAGYVGVVGLSVISAALLTRHLGVVRFGEYTTVISLVGVISSITDAGMSNLGTREFTLRTGADREGLMRDLLGLRISLTLVGVLVAVGFAVAAGYDAPRTLGTIVAALSVVALVFQHTLSIPLSTSLRLGAISALELSRQALTVVLIVVLIALDAGLFPLLAVALVVNLLLLLPASALVRGEISIRPAFHLRRWKVLLSLTVAFSLATAANTLYLYAAQILTSLVASGHQSGLFAASFRVFIVIATIPGLLVGGAFPVLTRAARDDPQRLGYAVARTVEVSAIVGAAALIGAVTGAPFIVKVVAGPQFGGAVTPLRIEGLALLASFLMAGWGFALLSLHRHRELLVANLVALTVSVVLTLTLASAHGATGAALASACGEVVLAALYLAGLVRSNPELRTPLEVPAKVVLAALPALALAFATGLPTVLPPLIALTVFAVLLLLLRAIPQELYEALPARLRRRRPADAG